MKANDGVKENREKHMVAMKTKRLNESVELSLSVASEREVYNKKSL